MEISLLTNQNKKYNIKSEAAKNLIETQEKYIKILEDELYDVMPLAFSHGYQSHRYEMSCNAREDLEIARERYK